MPEWLFTYNDKEIVKDYRVLQVVQFNRTVKTLVKDDADTPDVDFGRDFRRRLADDEAFRWQVPVGPGALRRQIHAVLRIVVILVHDL